MHSRTITRAAVIGFLALSIAACGGGSAATAVDPTDTEAAPAPVATAVVDPNADPNDPADVGAIIYDEAEPVPGTTLGACELVTPNDVRAAFGLDAEVPAGMFEANPTILSPGHSECRYEGDFGRVIVQLTPEDGANEYDAVYDAYDDREVIPGLGDGAFWAAEQNRGFVWQDRVTVMFGVYPIDQSLAGPALISSLGEAMLGKL